MLRPQKKYKDTWVKIIGSLFCSHFIEVMGRSESIFQLIVTKNYLLALFSGFLIALVIWELVSRLTVWLDEKYDWITFPVQRIFLQILLGFLLPAGLLYILTLLQMRWLFQQNIAEIDYLLYEFPAACLLIILVNAYYLVYYFYNRATIASTATAPVAEAVPEKGLETASGSIEEPKKSPVLLVSKGMQTLPLPVEQIAYVYKNNDFGFIKTFDGESFFNNFTLDELQSRLDEQLFFRANRQLIVHREACRSFTSLPYGKLELHLQPNAKEPVIISQKKAPAFREWLQQYK